LHSRVATVNVQSATCNVQRQRQRWRTWTKDEGLNRLSAERSFN